MLGLAGPALIVAAWAAVSSLQLFPAVAVPDTRGPWPAAWCAEFMSGRLVQDAVASLFRVGAGFLLATAIGIPAGLLLGHSAMARAGLLPLVNFFRNLSPLAWIPFAILWLGIGDPPAIFLIFMAAVFPVVLSTAAAVASIPSVYFRVARDLGIEGPRC